jgi:hypothetical protein
MFRAFDLYTFSHQCGVLTIKDCDNIRQLLYGHHEWLPDAFFKCSFADGFHIDFEAVRPLGRHDLLALAVPERYPNGAPNIRVPLPGSIDTLPLFGANSAPERYPD